MWDPGSRGSSGGGRDLGSEGPSLPAEPLCRLLQTNPTLGGGGGLPQTQSRQRRSPQPITPDRRAALPRCCLDVSSLWVVFQVIEDIIANQAEEEKSKKKKKKEKKARKVKEKKIVKEKPKVRNMGFTGRGESLSRASPELSVNVDFLRLQSLCLRNHPSCQVVRFVLSWWAFSCHLFYAWKLPSG